jgi:hypothetical protein
LEIVLGRNAGQERQREKKDDSYREDLPDQNASHLRPTDSIGQNLFMRLKRIEYKLCIFYAIEKA